MTKKPSEYIREGCPFGFLLNDKWLDSEIYWQIIAAHVLGCSREFLADCLEAKGM